MTQYSIWEHFDNIDDKCDNFGLTNQIIGTFGTAVEYWQIMNQIPHQDLKNIFFNNKIKKLPLYDINGYRCRINAIGIFQYGIMPEWEDDNNRNGGELQLRFFSYDNLAILQETWLDIVSRFVYGEFNKFKHMVGIRIVDKSDGSGMYFRIEFWFSEMGSVSQFKKYIHSAIQTKLFNIGVKSGVKIIEHVCE